MSRALTYCTIIMLCIISVAIAQDYMPKQMGDGRHGIVCTQSVQDCGTYGRCVPPTFDFPHHCTSCYPQTFRDECATDDECAAGHVCSVERNSCACTPRNVCEPGCALPGGVECRDETQQCNSASGLCVPRKCVNDSDCAMHTSVCSRRDNVCLRLPCRFDADCRRQDVDDTAHQSTGVCIDGVCFQNPGRCFVPYSAHNVRQHLRQSRF